MSEAGFLRASTHDPDSRAIFEGNIGQWLTRRQIGERVAAFVERLQFPRKALGFHFAFDDAAGVIGYLAAVEAGHAVVMLNPEMDAAMKDRLIALFQPDFLIAPASHPPEPGAEYAITETTEAAQLLFRAREPHRHAIHPELTVLLSTSGSTGSPKLVRLAWRNLLGSARAINAGLRNTEHDCSMVTAPIFNAYGQSVVHTMWMAGGRFAISRQRMISTGFWDAVRESECTTIGGTPYFYEALERLDLDSLNVPSVKKFVATGGRLPEHLARKYHFAAVKRGGTMHLMYGQAEATARISGLPPELLPEAARSIGYALPGGRVTIERDGGECAPMEEGELIFEGPGVMMGYALGPADLGKGDELGGRLATGDLGYKDERGLLYISGRKARFAKLFGWRVSLDDVEEMLSHTGPVAAVNERDRLVIYTERDGPAFAEAVRALAARLRIHPTAFEVRAVMNIPRLVNGKTNYGALASPASAPPRTSGMEGASAPPRPPE